MAKGLLITGTDTDVGKTFISGGLLYAMRQQGMNAGYYKPVLSGDCPDQLNDVQWVQQFAQWDEDRELVNKYRFAPAIAPHLAARLVGEKIHMEVIAEGYHQLAQSYEWLLVEGCGGLAVPLNDDGFMVSDLAKVLFLETMIVARAGLGTINHTVLTVRYAQSLGIKVKGIIINGYEGTMEQQENIAMITTLTGVECLALVPPMEGMELQEQRDCFTIAIGSLANQLKGEK